MNNQSDSDSEYEDVNEFNKDNEIVNNSETPEGDPTQKYLSDLISSIGNEILRETAHENAANLKELAKEGTKITYEIANFTTKNKANAFHTPTNKKRKSELDFEHHPRNMITFIS